MKIRLSLGKERVVSRELDHEEAVAMFGKLAEQMLDIVTTPRVIEKQIESKQLLREKMNDEESKCASVEPQEEQNQVNTEKALYSYKGFMYIKCPECGEVHGYCSKSEMNYHICKNCGKSFRFHDPLFPMIVKCECGSSFKYMTNMDEFAFDVNCIECGNPVAVKYNQDKKRYETIM